MEATTRPDTQSGGPANARRRGSGSQYQEELDCFLPRIFEQAETSKVVRPGRDNKGEHVVASYAVAKMRNLLSRGVAPNFEFEIDFFAMARLMRLHRHYPAIDKNSLKRARRRAQIPHFLAVKLNAAGLWRSTNATNRCFPTAAKLDPLPPGDRAPRR